MINIAKEIYTGWSVTRVGDLPGAEVLPVGDSDAEKKKAATFKQNHTVVKLIPNVPLPGFTLYKPDRKNYGSVVTWLIIDPRGFLVRITSENLASILAVTGITEGLIQEECVWARNNNSSDMILVPTSSPKYHTAVSNTVLIDAKVDIKDVNIGDSVNLQNGISGIYRGVVSLYGKLHNTVRLDQKPISAKRVHIVEFAPAKFHFSTKLEVLNASAPVVKAIKTASRADSVEYINGCINKSAAYFTPSDDTSSTYYSVQYNFSIASLSATDVVMTFEEVQDMNNTTITNTKPDDYGRVILKHKNGGLYLINPTFNYASNLSYSHSSNIHVMLVEPFDITKPQTKLTLSKKRPLIWHSAIPTEMHMRLSDFESIFKIKKHVKDDIYE